MDVNSIACLRVGIARNIRDTAALEAGGRVRRHLRRNLIGWSCKDQAYATTRRVTLAIVPDGFRSRLALSDQLVPPTARTYGLEAG